MSTYHFRIYDIKGADLYGSLLHVNWSYHKNNEPYVCFIRKEFFL